MWESRSIPGNTDIKTARLDLILFTPEQLAAVLSGAASSIEDAALPIDWARRTERTLRRRLDQVTRDPSCAPWLLRAIVLRQTRQFVGRIGFHGKPGTNAIGQPNAVELGYSVEADFRRRGIAEEAVRGMMSWAQTQSISAFVLSIGPANTASLQLAAKLGFKEVTRVIDEEGDGPEVVFKLEN